MFLNLFRTRVNYYFSTAKPLLLGMKVIPIPMLTDNYGYMVHGSKIENTILVDPAESKVVLPFLTHFPHHKISHIFLTHKHWDHVGDVDVLIKELGTRYEHEIEVVAGEVEKIGVTTFPIKEKKKFSISEIEVTAIPTPCHTLGAISFYLEDKNHYTDQNDPELIKKSGTECIRCVFTGDTHFIGGCGKFFEGDAKMMLKNMDTLGELPKDTFVFPGHEYTASNLQWAMGIEWENEAYAKKLEQVQEKIEKGDYSIPSTIAEEFDINIFWRTRNPIIQERVGKKDPVEVMHELRKLKDQKASLKKATL